ncbi:MAG: hypothetical protein GXO39_09230 [Thermotogae bacterium]|nr:hypothetical protein [Thermotogota bacterium]
MRYLLILSAFLGCGGPSGVSQTAPKPSGSNGISMPAGKEPAEQAPQEFAILVLKALKEGDIEKFASYVSPSGVVLSPDAYLSRKDVILTPEQLVEAWKENRRFLWGHQPGSGKPIELPIREFFKRYLYDRDYLNAPKRSTNRRLGRSNTEDNLKLVFPDAVIVEFYYPPSKEGGMDWSSLRMALRKENGGWKVVALVHDSWTP